MTSLSPRKHQTTRLSTLVRKTSWLAGIVCVIGATTLQAAEPGTSPLDKLRNRNPSSRWEQLKDGVLKRKNTEQHERMIMQPRVQSPIQAPPPLPPLPSRPSEIQQTAAAEDVNVVETGYQGTTSDPRQLKKVTSILPYADYQPEMHVRTDIDPSLQAPEEVPLTSDGPIAHAMTPTCFQWQASDLYHNPLYFEDPALERYGHTYHPVVQPFASAGRFGVQLIGLPYQMTIDPPCKRMYTLGWYRPGECAPKQFPNFPWNTKAAIVEGAVITGGFFIFP